MKLSLILNRSSSFRIYLFCFLLLVWFIRWLSTSRSDWWETCELCFLGLLLLTFLLLEEIRLGLWWWRFLFLCLMRLGLGFIGFLCLKKIPSMGTILTFIIGSWDWDFREEKLGLLFGYGRLLWWFWCFFKGRIDCIRLLFFCWWRRCFFELMLIFFSIKNFLVGFRLKKRDNSDFLFLYNPIFLAK